ncbi:MAG: tetratricopeptide repeat protein [Phycisphaerales bacterium]
MPGSNSSPPSYLSPSSLSSGSAATLSASRKASSAAEGLRLGTEAFEQGDYERTLNQLNRYLPSNQDDADALYMHAKARLEVPQDGGAHFPTALNWARRATDLDPDSVEKRLLVLEVLARSQSGPPQDYLAAIDNVLSLDPNRTDLRVLKADVLRRFERPDDALRELQAIISRDPNSLEAVSSVAVLLANRPAEYNQWVAELDRRAAESPDNAALDIARIDARLRLISPNPSSTGTSAITASRALTAFDILTESLLPKTINDPKAFRAALAVVDDIEYAIRLTRPQSEDERQATLDRLNSIDERVAQFIDRHTAEPAENPARLLAAMEWLWTSDRTTQLEELATRWRAAGPGEPDSSATLAIESFIKLTDSLPAEELADLPESSPHAAGQIWIHLAEASGALGRNELTETERLLDLANETIASVGGQALFSIEPAADRSVETFIANLAIPTLTIYRAESAAASGDTARAITLWFDVYRARRAWDFPALQLLQAFRDRGSINDAEEMSRLAMLRGATLGTGLSLIQSRVDQYALGMRSYEDVSRSLDELGASGFPEPQILVAKFRLALLSAIREPDRASESAADAKALLRSAIDDDTEPLAAAETVVRMLRAADELGVLNNTGLLPPSLVESASQAVAAQFANLSPQSKFAASLIEVARTGVYGPALARLTDEVRRFSDGPGTTDAKGFEHERILVLFIAELARTYEALEEDAFDRALAFSEAYPDNAAAQLLFIDSLLRGGEVQPVRTGPLTEALDRLKNVLGADSYTYNFAESRRLYASAQTRTPEVARQEIISRLDRFVEGPQADTASAEVLHLVSKWWELLPNSLERRLGYLRRAQQTSPNAWGIYPDFVRALGEAGNWDEASEALADWSRQLTPPLGLRASVAISRSSPGTSSTASPRRPTTRAQPRSRPCFGPSPSKTRSRSPMPPVCPATDSAPRRSSWPRPTPPTRERAMAILGLGGLAADRVNESRPASAPRGAAVADLTIAAAVRYAEELLRDLPEGAGLNDNTLLAVAAAAQLIAENHNIAQFTLDVAGGRESSFPVTTTAEPRVDPALRAIAQAASNSTEELRTRAEALFFAIAYRPETWEDEAAAARSAMLAAAPLESLTEAEKRALVYPLSQLGELQTAIELQRRVAEIGEADSDRITDVIAIAEILREAGRTQDAYETLDALSADDQARLATADIPAGTQALVALLELETEQQQTPVTSAFARRIIDQPRETLGTLRLAIERADGSEPRVRLLRLVSDELTQLSTSGPGAGEFRPFVADLWFNAAAMADESDPLRRELLTQAITRLNTVAQINLESDSPEDRRRRVFAYRRKAYCEIELGSVDTGIRTYRQALDIEPTDPATLNNLADALKRRGQFPEALQTAERAVAAAATSDLPDSAISVFYDTLGGSHLAVGDTEAALVALRTSIDLDPSNASARVTLAEAQIEAGIATDLIRVTIEPIGPSAEQAMSSSVRERLKAVRQRLGN